MKHFIFLLTTLFISTNTIAQNLFPVKLDNCKTEKFCLDCGDIKAGYDDKEFQKINEKPHAGAGILPVSRSINLSTLFHRLLTSTRIGILNNACT